MTHLESRSFVIRCCSFVVLFFLLSFAAFLISQFALLLFSNFHGSFTCFFFQKNSSLHKFIAALSINLRRTCRSFLWVGARLRALFQALRCIFKFTQRSYAYSDITLKMKLTHLSSPTIGSIFSLLVKGYAFRATSSYIKTHYTCTV